MISVTLRENLAFTWQGAASTPRYFCDVELDATQPHRVTLPVYWRPGPSPARPELYVADVAGWRLECGNIFALRREVLRTLQHLQRYDALPEYFFVVGNDSQIAPVYRVEGRLRTRLRGSPIFLAPDIGTLAVSVRRYLSADHTSPDVVVARVSRTDLQLYEPSAMLEAEGRTPLWIPVYVEAGSLLAEHGGQVFPAQPLSYTLEGLLQLRRDVAAHLVRCGLIHQSGQLLLRLPSARVFEELRAALPPSEYVLHISTNGARRPVAVHRIGPEFVVCHTPGPTIAVGETLEELRQRLGASLAHSSSDVPAMAQRS